MRYYAEQLVNFHEYSLIYFCTLKIMVQSFKCCGECDNCNFYGTIMEIERCA